MLSAYLADATLIPAALLDAYVVPVFKRKGSPLEAANYRPVVLLNLVLKVLNRIHTHTPTLRS